MKSTRTLLIIAIALLTVLLFRTCDDTNSRINPDDMSNLIPDSLAIKMRNLYVKNQYKFINSGLEQNHQTSELDYTHFSIPIKEMEDYIRYVKQIAEDHNYKYLGLRFYLGATLDAQNQIPLSKMFYGAIAVPDSITLQEPIVYKEMDRLFETPFADKVGCGGKPPGGL